MISWSLNELDSLVLTIQYQIERIEEQKDSIQNLVNKVASEWESPAGVAYLEKSSDDLRDIDEIINNMNEFLSNIKKARVECYERCENDIRRIVSSESITSDGSVFGNGGGGSRF